jgi:hypothetical protein
MTHGSVNAVSHAMHGGGFPGQLEGIIALTWTNSGFREQLIRAVDCFGSLFES